MSFYSIVLKIQHKSFIFFLPKKCMWKIGWVQMRSLTLMKIYGNDVDVVSTAFFLQ